MTLSFRKPPAMSDEERMVELEIRVARQDDMLEVLNQTVYRQQKQIDDLQALCAALARRLQEMRDAPEAGPANDKPPHY